MDHWRHCSACLSTWSSYILPFFERLWFPYRILGFTFIALSVAGALLLEKYRGMRWALPVAVLWMAGAAESIQLRVIAS